MADLNLLRIMYVGRKTDVIASLQTLFEQQNNSINANGLDGHAPVEFKAVTNQKTALHCVRIFLPALILVELNQQPDGRARLCEMLRYRLRTAFIVAIGVKQPSGAFAFDGHIQLPLMQQQVLETVLNFRRQRVDDQLQLGPIQLNLATRTVTTPKGQYTMTPKQCALLELLMMNHGKVVSRSNIMQSIWETSYLEDTRTLDVHVRWLRERIEPDPSSPLYLQTVRGVGYRLLIGN